MGADAPFCEEWLCLGTWVNPHNIRRLDGHVPLGGAHVADVDVVILFGREFLLEGCVEFKKLDGVECLARGGEKLVFVAGILRGAEYLEFVEV